MIFKGDTSKPPATPPPDDGSFNLVFGCGHIDYSPWGLKNVDIRNNFPHIHFPLVDVGKKLPWPDKTVDCIIAESILEHIPHGFWESGVCYSVSHLKTVSVLSDWCRVLKPGGMVAIKVPNIRGLIVQYLKKNIKPHEFWMYLYGGQEYKENTHLSGFDPEMLTDVMTLAGFTDIKIVNCHDWEQNLSADTAWEMTGIGYRKGEQDG